MNIAETTSAPIMFWMVCALSLRAQEEAEYENISCDKDVAKLLISIQDTAQEEDKQLFWILP